jgi:nucleotide-binding universal stress UspA family protein
MRGRKQRWVAATDFSRDAGYACHRAALLAAEHGAQLELLHVVGKAALDTLRQAFRTKPARVADLLDDLRRALARTGAALAKQTGASIASRVEIGAVQDVIAAQCRRADLLVVGAHGTNPLRDAILGTTAERLLGTCRRPVLVVKRPPEHAYARALVAMDFSAPAKSALRAALRLAPGAAFTAVHAYDLPFEGKLRLAGVEDETIDAYRFHAARKAAAAIRALGEKSGIHLAHAVYWGHPPVLILEKERALRSDLIVLGKAQRSVAKELFLGSVSRHVLADCRGDVLVVPG